MGELLYDIDSGLIAIVLLLTMALAMEVGYRLGLRNMAGTNDASKEHINSIQASILGILALLLGFTFSLALQRYDSRSEAVVDEANAIGTAYLRAQLLPAALREEVLALVRSYVDLRVQADAHSQTAGQPRAELLAKAATVQTAMWSHARRALELDPNSYTPILFAEAVNTLIDSFGKRDAALNRHVPEVVLLLLYATFLMAGGIVGFASGVSSHRPSTVSYFMVILMVILVFIILDLDRPRRGLIQVSQKSMVELQTSVIPSKIGR